MPEYDAFGREIGEDPLEPLRTAPAPASEPAQERVAVPPPRVELRLGRRRRRGGLAGVIVVVAALGAGLLALGNVGGTVQSGIEDVVEGSGVTGDGPAPTGVTGRSLIRERNFAAAIATLRRSGLGRPFTMRVAPDRIDAALIGKGKMHQVQITPGGDLAELTSGDAPPRAHTIDYRKIDVSAPERLTRAGATKKVPSRRIDYLVLSPGPPPTWGAYYKGGRIVFGDAHGHKQRVL